MAHQISILPAAQSELRKHYFHIFVENRVAGGRSLGKSWEQQTVKRLHWEGYIEVCEVTHVQSPERECLPTRLTEKARRLFNAASHRP